MAYPDITMPYPDYIVQSPARVNCDILTLKFHLLILEYRPPTMHCHMLYDDIVMPHPDIKAPLTLEYISSHKFALENF